MPSDTERRARWGPRFAEVDALRATRRGIYNRLLKCRKAAGSAWSVELVAAFLEEARPLEERIAKP